MGEDMKVLMLSAEYPPHHKGGQGIQTSELARELVRAGAEVEVISLVTEKSETLVRDGVNLRFRAPEKTRGSSSADDLLGQIDAFNEVLAREAADRVAAGGFRPDLIHCQDWLLYRVAVHLRRRFAVPVVGSVHLLDEPIQSWWGVEPHPENVRREAEYLQGLDAVIAVSHALAEIIRKTHDLPAGKLHVVHNGVDTTLFRKDGLAEPVRTKLRRTLAEPKEKLVLFAGRLSPVKGLDALVASAAKASSACAEVRYLVVGEASSRESNRWVKELLAAQPHLAGRMKLLGRVDRKQLALLYQVADLALVTSLYESFPYAVTEAMACAKAVVATDTGGIPEIVTHDENGLLVPVHVDPSGRRRVDVEALAQAQLELLADSRRAARLAAAGYHHVHTHLTFENMVQGTLDVYRTVLSHEDAT